MSRHPTGLRKALAGVLLVAAALTAHADGPAPISAPKLSPAHQNLIALLDPFNLPAVKGKEFVRVWTGQLGARGCCRGRSETLRFGFLLEETDDYFRVVHDFWPVTYEKTVQGLRGRAPRYEKTPFEAFALRPTRDGFNPQRLSWSHLVRSQARPGVALELVILARAASQRGLTAQAGELLALARKKHERRGGKAETLEAHLQDELPRALLWGAIEGCAQARVDRRTLLERFKGVAGQFPTHESHAALKSYAAVLESMVREDERRAEGGALLDPAATPLGPELIELRAPVDDLVYQLRDLHAPLTLYRRAQVAHFKDPQSASSRLLAMGRSAIPRLIALTDDPRLTRVIDGSPQDQAPEARVLRYGDVALQIVNRIAGRDFASGEAAAEWWADVKEFGEAQVLDRMIREGGRDAVALGRKLHALDPDRALTALMATSAELEGSARDRIVSYIAAQKGPRVDAFLLREVRTAPELRTRLTAARTLHRRGSELWSEPLVSELARRSRRGLMGTETKRARDVIRFVVPAGNLYSVEALRRVYPHLAPDEKRNLLESAARVPRNRSDRSAICEAILTSALGDTTHWAQPWSWNGVRCMDAQLGEIAAVLLASQLGQTFDPMSPPFERALRVAQLRNLCLTSRGMPPRPLPGEPEPPTPGDPGELAAAIEALRIAAWPEEIERALTWLRTIGLAAVPALNELVQSKDLDGAAQLKARRTVEALASTVREVRVTDEIGVLTAGDLSELRSLVGTPLSAVRLRELIARHTQQLSRVVDVAVHRDGRARGVSIRFAIRHRAVGRHNDRLVYSLRIGKRFSRNSMNLRSGRQAMGWQRLESRLRALLEGDASVDGELRLRLGR